MYHCPTLKHLALLSVSKFGEKKMTTSSAFVTAVNKHKNYHCRCKLDKIVFSFYLRLQTRDVFPLRG